jgi:hypothetical protein
MFRAISQNLFEPSTTAESIPGSQHRLGACASDRGLFYVDSAGAYAGSYGSSYKPASTDVLVVQYANSGPLVLEYRKAAATLEQGEVVTFDTSDASERAVAGATDSAAGVALCDVASGSYAWFAIDGECLADCDGDISAGLLLDTGAAGEFTITGGTKADAQAVGVVNTAPAGAGLKRVKLLL